MVTPSCHRVGPRVRWDRRRLARRSPRHAGAARFAGLLLVVALGLGWFGLRPWLRVIRTDEPLLEVRVGDRIGLVTVDGFVVCPPSHDHIGPFDEAGMATVRRGDRYGWINRQGRMLIPIRWEMPLGRNVRQFGLWSATPPQFKPDGHAIVGESDKVGMIDRQGRIVIPMDWEWIGEVDDPGLISVRRDDRWGCLDRDGRPVIPVRFDQPVEFGRHALAAVKLAGRWGVIDRAGRMALPPEWDGVILLDRADRVVAERNGRWGVLPVPPPSVKPAEREIESAIAERRDGPARPSSVPAVSAPSLPWDDLDPFSEDGLARVRIDEKRGAIDRKGEVVVPIEWDFIDGFNDAGLAIVRRKFRYGVIDRRGNVIVEPTWHRMSHFDDGGLAAVRGRSRWGLIDRSGREVVGERFDRIDGFDDGGRAVVERDGQVGVINRRGEVVIPLSFEAIDRFELPPSFQSLQEPLGGLFSRRADGKRDSAAPPDLKGQAGNGFARVWKNRLCGMIDDRGRLLAPIQFDDILPFDGHGLAAARFQNRWGWLRKEGPWSVEPKWLQLRPLSGVPFAAVQSREGWGVVNARGEILIPPRFEDVVISGSDLVIVEKNELRGLMDLRGGAVTPIEFDQLESIPGTDSFFVRKGSRVGVINRSGGTVLPLEHEGLAAWSTGGRDFFVAGEEFRRFQLGGRLGGPPRPEPGETAALFVSMTQAGIRRYALDGTPIDREPWDWLSGSESGANAGYWLTWRTGPPVGNPRIKELLEWANLKDHPLFRGGAGELRDSNHRLVWSSANEARRSLALPAAVILLMLALLIGRPRGARPPVV